jgi:hypothetical protein
MSYSEARNHFEKARSNITDQSTIDLLEGLKHLSHAIEEDVRAVLREMRDISDIQNRKPISRSVS